MNLMALIIQFKAITGLIFCVSLIVSLAIKRIAIRCLCVIVRFNDFSSLIDGSYPRVFRQYFLINRFDPIGLLSAAHHFTLSMGSSIQTVKVCVKRSKVQYFKPGASTTDAFEAMI